MNDERKELLGEANSLGLEFAPNIGNQKLKELIANVKGEPIPIKEDAPPGPKVKEDSEEVSPEENIKKTESGKSRIRMLVATAKKKAMKKSIVTITNKDNRENDVMTTVYLSFENQYFALSKLVPLDVPVELEESLIHIAESTIMTLHKDEIVDGKRTGNKTPQRVKKFAISYGKPAD